MYSFWAYPLQKIVYFGFIIICVMPFALGQQGFDPDSIPPNAKGEHNPDWTLCCMHSWSAPVLDHNGKPHRDGHIIQIIADGGNAIQDPPNPDGSPGGDDTLADGNFTIQYVNGEKHIPDGLKPGMFIGMRCFVPYKPDMSVYVRLWEGHDPMTSEYYQDSEEYTTLEGDKGGQIVSLQRGIIKELDWRFGPSKRVARKK